MIWYPITPTAVMANAAQSRMLRRARRSVQTSGLGPAPPACMAAATPPDRPCSPAVVQPTRNWREDNETQPAERVAERCWTPPPGELPENRDVEESKAGSRPPREGVDGRGHTKHDPPGPPVGPGLAHGCHI